MGHGALEAMNSLFLQHIVFVASGCISASFDPPHQPHSRDVTPQYGMSAWMLIRGYNKDPFLRLTSLRCKPVLLNECIGEYVIRM